MRQQRYSTTPFGRRSLLLTHVISGTITKCPLPKNEGHRWTDSRTNCTAGARTKVSEWAAAQEARLAFCPDSWLIGKSSDGILSNYHTSLRLHGLLPATSQRHVALSAKHGRSVLHDTNDDELYARKAGGTNCRCCFSFRSLDAALSEIMHVRAKFKFPIRAALSSFSLFGRAEQRTRRIRPRSGPPTWPDISSSRGLACG
jgi:hypothetical protein